MKIKPIVLATLTSLSLAASFPTRTFAQPLSGCTARLVSEDRDAQINVREGPGRQYRSPHYGVVGDEVIILQGGSREGFAIEEDRNSMLWVKVEFPNSGARGWVRRDFVSRISC
ncbi:SH3 domain-containing protein [Ancylothrix sp. C2]|uniref:SH3 domain-containing protein n=1 Tax=Ancylothrix sp. D3o TaxID=2953691 RepID=UPI0021BA3FCB|nr:SH3 domain-containing protein [Ancylothrix sp. D3o]MCT7950999.1 SH3 domain-containing protein [Ancylothrix sp. D3o]